MVDLFCGGDVHGRREGVVAGLGAVDVVVRVDGGLAPHSTARDLDRAVGDDLVGVHVGLGPRACLPDSQREVLVQGAGDDFVAGRGYQRADVLVHLVQLDVGLARGLLENPEGSYDRTWHRVLTDVEIEQ